MISSKNEWDTLKKVVLGSATNANWPINDPVFTKTVSSYTLAPTPKGPVAQWIIDETNEDLDILAAILTSAGIEVIRPTDMDFTKFDGMYNYCPRDRLLIHGSAVIDVAMMYPCRDQEIQCLQSVLNEAEIVITMPRDQGLILDAANICRLNDTWLFLNSASGNIPAYNWLVKQLPDINIELVKFYSGVHIDSTVTPLREGLVMLNGSRIDDSNYPKVFKTWKRIYIQPDQIIPNSYYEYPYASSWIALNMLVVNPQLVIVDAAQKKLIKILEENQFDVIPLTLRHSRTLGGGFHCVTLDLIRE